MKMHTLPFKHCVIDNFLPNDDFDTALDCYNKQKFDEKHTDLFKFMQTGEISTKRSLSPLKKKLTELFTPLCDTKNCYYTMFASYYRKNDYLLCHDDLIDEREYAFTFYLTDFQSGDLVLYDSKCEKEVKRINVRRNRLVVFEVSAISYHEVDICTQTGRKAITGWINMNGKVANHIDVCKWDYSLPHNITFSSLDLDLSEHISVVPDIYYDFTYHTKFTEGKFYMRRMHNIHLETYVALQFQGYNLIYINSYEVDNMSYILLNDYTNAVDEHLLDVFIIESPVAQEGNIHLVDSDGVLYYTLPIENRVMYVVNRGSNKYFIENGKCLENYHLAHLIYTRKEQ